MRIPRRQLRKIRATLIFAPIVKRKLRHITGKLVCWILLLQLLNVSINPPDPVNYRTATASSRQIAPFDEVETIYELVAQEIFDFDVEETGEEEIDTSSHVLELFYSEPKFELIPITFSIVHNSPYRDSNPTFHPEPRFLPPKSA